LISPGAPSTSWFEKLTGTGATRPPFDPSAADKRHAELLERIDALSREVVALRMQTASE
jgi:hypothetical protein